MSSRLSIWGKALAAHPVNRENNRQSQRPPVAGKARPGVKGNREPETTPPAPPPKAETKPPQEEFRRPEVNDQSSVYATPETWSHGFQKQRQARPYTASEFPPGRPRMKKEQRRRNTISIALSEEEESLVRAAAADKGISMSDWARRAFFRYMGRKPPARDMRRVDWTKGPEILKDDEEG
jgi:hypothetical protein